MIGKIQIIILYVVIDVITRAYAKNLEPDFACGKRFIRKGRIVGGKEAYDGEVPWMASVLIRGTHHCGGTILNRRWILTAAHCFFSTRTRNYMVRVGEYDYQSETEDHKPVDIALDKIYRHPQYADPYRYSNDIALVRLKKDISFNNYTWPICVDDGSVNLTDRMTNVAGWGKLKEGGSFYPGPLQVVKLPVIENKICQKRFFDLGKKWLIIENSQICAGYDNGGKDACQGDSGGPQFVKEGDKYTLVGVVSSGIGCARPLTAGLFSRVSYQLRWIEDAMTNSS